MSDFDPVVFLYLNPELQADGSVTTVEDATTYYASDPNASNLLISLSNLPGTFDPEVYIVNNKALIDIGGINRAIRDAMSNDGLSLKQIEAGGEFLSTVYQPAILSNLNTFTITGSGFSISTSNLQVGDLIKFLKNNYENIYARVETIVNGTTFTVKHPTYANYQFCDNLASYVLVGIKLYDAERLARIAYLRYLDANATEAPYLTIGVDYETQFNPDLYKLLYPDARLFTKEEAYLDYRSRLANEESRVGIAADLFSLKMPVDIQEAISNNGLKLGEVFIADGKAFFNNETTYEGPTLYKDTVTFQHNAIFSNISECEIGSSPCPPLTAGFYGRTEFRGITDVYGPITFYDTVTSTCNLVSLQKTTLSELSVQSNAHFLGPSLFSSNVLFGNTVTFSNAPVTAYAPVTFTTLTVTDETTLQSNLRVTASSTFEGVTVFSNDVFFTNGSAYIDALVLNNATICNDAKFDGGLTVYGETKMYNLLDVYSNAAFRTSVTVQDDLQVHGDTTLGGCNLTVLSPTTDFTGSIVNVRSNLLVQDSLITSNLQVDAITRLLGPTTLAGETVATAPVFFTGNATFCNGLVSTDVATFYGLHASNIFASNVTIDHSLLSNLTVPDAVRMSSSSIQLTAPLTASNVATFESNVFFKDQVTYQSNVVFQGLTTFQGEVFFGENIIGDELARLQNLSVSNLSVTNDATLCNVLVLGPTVDFCNERVYMASNLWVGGTANLESAVINQTTLCNETRVLGSTDFENTVTFYETAYFESNAVFADDATFQGSLMFSQANGTTLVTQDMTTCNLNVIETATLCNIVVNGETTVNGPAQFTDRVTICNLYVTDKLFLGESSFDVDIAFSNAQFSGTVTTCNLVVTNKLTLNELDVNSNMQLTNVQVADTLTACNIVLTNQIVLSENAFGSNVIFQGGEFRDTLTASNLTITGSLTVSDGTFGPLVTFCNVQVQDTLTSCNLVVSHKLILGEDAFDSNVTFSNATVRDTLTACNITITGELILGENAFSSNVIFQDALVRGILTACNVSINDQLVVNNATHTSELHAASIISSNIITSNVATSNLFADFARINHLSVDLIMDSNYNVTIGDFENAIDFVPTLPSYEYTPEQIAPDSTPFMIGFEEDVFMRSNLWVQGTVTCSHLIARNFLVQGIPTFCNQILALGSSTFCNDVICFSNVSIGKTMSASNIHVGVQGAIFDGMAEFNQGADFYQSTLFYDDVTAYSNVDILGERMTVHQEFLVKGPSTFSNPVVFTDSNTMAYLTVVHALDSSTAHATLGPIEVTDTAVFKNDVTLTDGATIELYETSTQPSPYFKATANGLLRNRWIVVDHLKTVQSNLEGILVYGFASNVSVSQATGSSYYDLYTDASVLQSVSDGNTLRIDDHIYEVSVITPSNLSNGTIATYLLMKDVMDHSTLIPSSINSNQSVQIEVLENFVFGSSNNTGGGGGGAIVQESNVSFTLSNLIDDVSTSTLVVERFTQLSPSDFELEVSNHTFEGMRRQIGQLYTLQTSKDATYLSHMVRLTDVVHMDGFYGNDTLKLHFTSVLPWRPLEDTESGLGALASASNLSLLQLIAPPPTPVYSNSVNISAAIISGTNRVEYEIQDPLLVGKVNRDFAKRTTYLFNNVVSWVDGSGFSKTAHIVSSYADIVQGKVFVEFEDFEDAAYAALHATLTVPFCAYPGSLIGASTVSPAITESNVPAVLQWKFRTTETGFSSAITEASKGINSETAYILVYDEGGALIWRLRAVTKENDTDYLIQVSLQDASASIPAHYANLRVIQILPVRYRDVSVFQNVHFSTKLGILTTDPTETLTVHGDLSCQTEFILRDDRTKSYTWTYSNDTLFMQDDAEFKKNQIILEKDTFVRGNLLAHSLNQTSDRRLKRNIQETSPQEDLLKLRQLSVKRFEFVDPNMGGARRRKGIMAQDVETIVDKEAVLEVDGYIPYVYDWVTVSPRGDILLPLPPYFGEQDHDLQVGDVIRIEYRKDDPREPNVLWDVSIVGMQRRCSGGVVLTTTPNLRPSTDDGGYFFYGYKDRYKVVDMEALLMMTMNAVKALAEAVSPSSLAADVAPATESARKKTRRRTGQ